MQITSLISQNTLDFGDGLQPPMENSYTQGADDNLGVLFILARVISSILGTITVLGALFFIVYFFIAAFSWITGADDASKVEKARTRMIQSVLGLVVLVVSYSLLGVISSIVGIDFLNIAKTIQSIIPS